MTKFLVAMFAIVAFPLLASAGQCGFGQQFVVPQQQVFVPQQFYAPQQVFIPQQQIVVPQRQVQVQRVVVPQVQRVVVPQNQVNVNVGRFGRGRFRR